MGSAVGATTRLEDEYVVVSDHGGDWLVDQRYASRFLYQALVPSSLATEVACRFGAHGPAAVVSTGCTSGLDAVGYGHQLIEDGDADVVIAGRDRRADLAHLDGVLRRDPGDLGPQRRPGARLPPVRRHPRRVRDGRGRGRARPGGVRARPAARRRHLLRDRAGSPAAATRTT